MKSVILTNEQGESLGKSEIIEAHTEGGKLHKAFSVFIFSPDMSKILIQRRASVKMLFPGYWANTCCSHPKEKFPIEIEGADRLKEECGFRTGLSVADSFVYKADDPDGKGTEYEYDTVLIGTVEESTQMHPDPAEIMEMKWIELDELKKDMEERPETYAPWFHLALPIALDAR
ncbi:MAG: isopentenyl-diphosphate Delta-isomerase [Candidatus Peribacter sp.]|jgi:isopentenyl-diphosphate Delta-isomerase|nr:isopentenyl-diphosphate Delta-isomerase [Candidatus Peribacter sp.]MBT4392671.1 isopentenyl-diphosphate Delta-isomerase [Candidatus Peribacter sp.]MBT4600712.1 isopentenyl-diphosphate Delta-isomerase [Candidatus Peribacter sp.]MBT5148619.1 isopentenyl-diphosphate Delta-isomerase [Candidatus Peribacter sp.]MBT5637785.1 isopentenyl-diphosphate Delta-isomerase [Candidatus Peribacter sp.]